MSSLRDRCCRRRHRDARLTAAREQGAQHVDRRAHTGDQLVGRLGVQVGGGVDRQLARTGPVDVGADRAQHLDHHVEVGDRVDVGDGVVGRREPAAAAICLGAGVLVAPDTRTVRAAVRGAHDERSSTTVPAVLLHEAEREVVLESGVCRGAIPGTAPRCRQRFFFFDFFFSFFFFFFFFFFCLLVS